MPGQAHSRHAANAHGMLHRLQRRATAIGRPIVRRTTPGQRSSKGSRRCVPVGRRRHACAASNAHSPRDANDELLGSGTDPAIVSESIVAMTSLSSVPIPQPSLLQNCSPATRVWKGKGSGDLKDLASDARQLQHETEKASAAATKDARGVIASAKAELRDIVSQAHSDIQAAADLGAACSDENNDETTTTNTTTTTTTTNTTTTTSTNSVTAPSDATSPADTTEGAHTFDTSGLDAKYKDIVDQAIKDMQKVVDDARLALLNMTTVAESKEATEKDADKVEQQVEKAKADRHTAKQEREDAKKAKATTKSQHSGKGKPHVRDANTEEDRD